MPLKNSSNTKNQSIEDETKKIKLAHHLFKDIETLAKHHIVTPELAEWAHEIRDDGNEATHDFDIDYDETKANQIVNFAEMFLTYTFTMPAMLHAKHLPQIETDTPENEEN